MLEKRRAAIISVIFFLFLVGSASGVSDDPTLGNWVEVIRFEGKDSMQTELFTCDCPEWRIRWEFDPGHFHFFPEMYSFSFTTYPQDEYINYVDSVSQMGNESRSGTSYIHNNGTFFMRIKTGAIDSYTIMVEQNLESIPEFPSWTILPLLLTATLVALVYRKRLHKTSAY